MMYNYQTVIFRWIQSRLFVSRIELNQRHQWGLRRNNFVSHNCCSAIWSKFSCNRSLLKYSRQRLRGAVLYSLLFMYVAFERESSDQSCTVDPGNFNVNDILTISVEWPQNNFRCDDERVHLAPPPSRGTLLRVIKQSLNMREQQISCSSRLSPRWSETFTICTSLPGKKCP